jgi:hypothetical protein
MSSARRGMGIGSRWTRRGWSLASEPVVETERSPDMDGTAGTVIIGAGQVGLAMSWCLRDRPIASRPPRTRERSCPSEPFTHDAISGTPR